MGLLDAYLGVPQSGSGGSRGGLLTQYVAGKQSPNTNSVPTGLMNVGPQQPDDDTTTHSKHHKKHAKTKVCHKKHVHSKSCGGKR